MKRIDLPEEVLRYKYVREGKTTRKIAEEIGTNSHLVWDNLKRYGIKTRNSQEARCINLKYNMIVTNNNLPDDWIVGFVDGEGTFSVAIAKDPQRKSGYRIKPYFQIAQNDLRILYEIKKFFGIGAVIIRKITSYYRVEGFNQSWMIRDFFSRHPPIAPEKRDQFYRWCAILDHIQKKRHDLTVKDIEHIRKLRNGVLSPPLLPA